MSHEPRHDKTNKMSVCPAKIQISLSIRPVWSESSLSAWRNLGSLATHYAHSEDSDQTGRMPRLIWVFAGRSHFVGFVMSRLTLCNNFIIMQISIIKPCSLIKFRKAWTTRILKVVNDAFCFLKWWQATTIKLNSSFPRSIQQRVEHSFFILKSKVKIGCAIFTWAKYIQGRTCAFQDHAGAGVVIPFS